MDEQGRPTYARIVPTNQSINHEPHPPTRPPKTNAFPATNQLINPTYKHPKTKNRWLLARRANDRAALAVLGPKVTSILEAQVCDVCMCVCV